MTITLETDMEIRFCELCQESIPDADFESGRAVALDGRSVCVSCGLKRALSLSGARSWLTLLVALVALGLSTWLLLRPTAEPGLPGAVSDALATQRRETLGEARRELVVSVESLKSEVARTRSELVQPLEGLGSDVKQLAERTASEREESRARVELLEGRLGALKEQLVQVQALLVELRARAAAEVAAPRPATGEPPTPEPATPTVEPPAPPPPLPAPSSPPGQVPDAVLQRQLDLLNDPDPGIAFSATIDLGKLKDLRAVAPLIAALRKHKDFYVRLGAADALRELKACDAVEHLIDALLDKDDLVRSSVNVALQGITQHEESFAPNMPTAELRRVQSAWRKWWKENEAAVRARLERRG